MLANFPRNLAQSGSLSRDVHRPAAFRYELLSFVADELPRWRDRADRTAATSEASLTSQLCAHLNSTARHSNGWDILQFRVEEPDERQAGRKIDMVSAPCGTTVWIDGRRHSDFDTILPIECKRLPTPIDKDRDEREYVFSKYSTTGGIQRFKAGHHGAGHSLAAMIAYIQKETRSIWYDRVTGWINDLDSIEQGWSASDSLKVDRADDGLRLTVLSSSHERHRDLTSIELRHLWLEMN